MIDDINERIARLVEPNPFRIGDCDTFGIYVSPLGGYRGQSIPGTYGDNKEIDWSPVAFTESIDASMAVIQRRWPDAYVTLTNGAAEIELSMLREGPHDYGDADNADVGPIIRGPVHRREIIGQAFNDRSIAHALALALLAALEAETEP